MTSMISEFHSALQTVLYRTSALSADKTNGPEVQSKKPSIRLNLVCTLFMEGLLHPFRHLRIKMQCPLTYSIDIAIKNV